MLTDPTTGIGVSSMPDIIIAEPDALIGFAGPRVIEQTVVQYYQRDSKKRVFTTHGAIALIG